MLRAPGLLYNLWLITMAQYLVKESQTISTQVVDTPVLSRAGRRRQEIGPSILIKCSFSVYLLCACDIDVLYVL